MQCKQCGLDDYLYDRLQDEHEEMLKMLKEINDTTLYNEISLGRKLETLINKIER